MLADPCNDPLDLNSIKSCTVSAVFVNDLCNKAAMAALDADDADDATKILNLEVTPNFINSLQVLNGVLS